MKEGWGLPPAPWDHQGWKSVHRSVDVVARAFDVAAHTVDGAPATGAQEGPESGGDQDQYGAFG